MLKKKKYVMNFMKIIYIYKVAEYKYSRQTLSLRHFNCPGKVFFFKLRLDVCVWGCVLLLTS